MTMTETWRSPAGVPAVLTPYTPEPYVPDDDEEYYDEGWYADFPGQRPPQSYRMVTLWGVTVDDFTVFPLDPWSPYDAASDRLVREGWTPPPPTDEELAQCEHGLSLRLCAGPEHYPMEEER